MLQELSKLRETLSQKYLLTFWDEDRELPAEFKALVTKIDTSNISYNENSFILSSSSGLKIYFPNQLWAIAAYFAKFYQAIEDYSVYIKTNLNLDKEEIKSCVDDESKTRSILDRFPNIDNEERGLLIKFLSNYKWWGGGKTIDRQDYYYSPIISLCGLVNASQGYVAELCKYLATNKSALALLEVENEKIAASHPKRLVASSVLSDFCVEVVRYLHQNSLLNELVSYATYSDCSWLGDGGKKVKIATANGSLTGLLLTNVSNNLDGRSDKERWFETPIIFDEKEAYISNQWCAPAGHQLTLVDLRNVLDDVFPSKYTIKEDKGVFYLYSGKDVYEPRTFVAPNTQPLQQIFYGAPGTGKSHTIETETKGKEVIRVTFHPDSDYSTFVGAYKPTTVEVPVRDVTGKVIKDNGEEVRESRVVYKFVPQAFLKAYVNAWQDLTKPVYLVIEEINRGNCAQIFGDIFQLLDRSENGYSSYEIDPDMDIQSFLAKEFAKAVDVSTSDKIKSGEKMMLPPNLYIWATMNTSDQSLFPIDSAFKRRWDWKYMPIDTEKENWKLEVNGKPYSWSSFLNKINEEIYKTTSSEDKMLGFYFCKAEEKKITAERFVSKVLFYIYNDVFKDYGLDSREFFKDKEDANNVITFQSLYDSKTQKIDEKRVEKLLTNLTVEVLQNSSQQLEANKVEMADD